MRASSRRGIVAVVIGAVLALGAVGCNTDDAKDAAHSAVSAGASAAASEVAEAVPSGVPTNLRPEVIDRVRKGLPGKKLSDEQIIGAIGRGFLVTTESGEPCESKPAVQGADAVYLFVLRLEPNGVVDVKVSRGDKALINGMHMQAGGDTLGDMGALAEGHFSCAEWQPGNYQVSMSVNGSEAYGSTVIVK